MSKRAPILLYRDSARHEAGAGRLRRAFQAARGPVIWLVLVAGLTLMGVFGGNWYATWRDNRAVAALRAGENVEIDAERSAPNVLYARASYLLKRDLIEEAQVLLDQANFRGDPRTRVSMLYNMANTRLRASFDAIERGAFDEATTLVGLAKEDYTEALRLDPKAWDVKHNLDVAARLVRDLPQVETTEEPAQEIPEDLWTHLPGAPKGGP